MIRSHRRFTSFSGTHWRTPAATRPLSSLARSCLPNTKAERVASSALECAWAGPARWFSSTKQTKPSLGPRENRIWRRARMCLCAPWPARGSGEIRAHAERRRGRGGQFFPVWVIRTEFSKSWIATPLLVPFEWAGFCSVSIAETQVCFTAILAWLPYAKRSAYPSNGTLKA